MKCIITDYCYKTKKHIMGTLNIILDSEAPLIKVRFYYSIIDKEITTLSFASSKDLLFKDIINLYDKDNIEVIKKSIESIDKDLIINCPNNCKRFTNEEIEYLRINYTKPYQILCRRLGRSISSVRGKLKDLGIEKTQDMFFTDYNLYTKSQICNFIESSTKWSSNTKIFNKLYIDHLEFKEVRLLNKSYSVIEADSFWKFMTVHLEHFDITRFDTEDYIMLEAPKMFITRYQDLLETGEYYRITPSVKWTEEEYRKLEQYKQVYGIEEVAQKLDKPLSTTKVYSAMFCKSKYNKYTKEDVEKVKYYRDILKYSFNRISEELNIPTTSVKYLYKKI